jgi:hypothetical protein
MRIRRDVVLRRLIAARDLISTKDNWVQGSEAVDNDGDDVQAESTSATRFCAVGAIRRVTFADARRRKEPSFSNSYYDEIKRRVDDEVTRDQSIIGNDIISVNDRPGGHSRRRVVKLFNRAIKTLETELEG